MKWNSPLKKPFSKKYFPFNPNAIDSVNKTQFLSRKLKKEI